MARYAPLFGAATLLTIAVTIARPIGAAPPSGEVSPDRVAERTFQRNCASCHMSFGANFGGKLMKDIVEGREEEIRRVILEGGTKMPAFKYMLRPQDADSLIAYIKTLDAPPEVIAAPQPEPWSKNDD